MTSPISFSRRVLAYSICLENTLIRRRGDACHPMLPYLAQGANSAIEDGTVLGLLLGYIESKEHVHHALETYESLRKTRGELIVRETFKQVTSQDTDILIVTQS
jgi:2-polyprenyl-6-methoxyphenol hydroxylase-like FAD-dependent oxidoreductase